MTTAFPGAIDSFTNPTSTDTLDSSTVPHAAQHDNANDAIAAIESTLGVNPQGSSATVAARFGTVIPLSTVTTAGDLIVATGSSAVTRLGIGSSNQVLTSNGTTATWATPAPAAWTSSAISGATNLVTRYQYFVTTSGGAITLTLPASPNQGDEIRIFDASGNAGTNNITVTPGSLKFQGSVQTLLINFNYASCTLVYTGSTYGWKVA